MKLLRVVVEQIVPPVFRILANMNNMMNLFTLIALHVFRMKNIMLCLKSVQDLCNNESVDCSSLYQSMLSDVSPYGQYGEITKADVSVNVGQV